MAQEDPPPAGDEQSVSVRVPELVLALLLMAIGGLVVGDSIRVGIGWGDDGPRSGYFPFYIGLLLLAASAWTAAKQLRQWAQAPAFAERGQLRLVLAVLLPLTVHIAVIAFVGLYVASALLIGYFMLRHGKHGWPLTAAVSIGVPLLFFLVFERWFLVPLPKGPLEALVGL